MASLRRGGSMEEGGVRRSATVHSRVLRSTVGSRAKSPRQPTHGGRADGRARAQNRRERDSLPHGQREDRGPQRGLRHADEDDDRRLRVRGRIVRRADRARRPDVRACARRSGGLRRAPRARGARRRDRGRDRGRLRDRAQDGRRGRPSSPRSTIRGARGLRHRERAEIVERAAEQFSRRSNRPARSDDASGIASMRAEALRPSSARTNTASSRYACATRSGRR